ncbi:MULTISPECIES: universal stress protein [unclassified Mesorhizobium]|uniref:universal stress protein n=2 Tax=Mesorhizobium TaxID=68287 RepID=UPI000F7592FD|nr:MULTISPECIES: universal stress protein [unclassified Mesorhizobium]AZO05506.1 universal stress protein [Mesorhizobium sp. M2A.F.Ca.ET.043.02.1.1]RUW40250.1 universal stress protein [Mesorhizobium sp. M2A.F.Ca.ET.015.02.1.1]RUW78054.1 universal stress protein [Mesorhizobium sp. M2A.F.Ca.ET.067.02.1.1]RVC98463.1 universal stress protein [Mesorhizobium sp. M2A.F.Ca.ET.017.03.2.1]RWB49147.1 MAG: universal stress protein [Mesorhizobium sp.]
MPFKTLLTVTGPDYGDGDLRLAAGLCEEIDAHLSVLVVVIAAPPSGGEYAAVISPAWLAEREAEMETQEKRSSAVSRMLSEGPVSADLGSEYPEQSWTDEIIGRRARYADLTIVGPEMLASGLLKDKVLAGSLFSSGKPILLVPQGARATLKPKRVLVAWDASLEASRAVREALDILSSADEVRIAMIDPIEDERHHGAEPGADLAAYLSRHGAKVAVDRLPSSGHSVAAVLRQHATDTGAELVVMGAYGHSRLRERIFGGVTKSMIEDPGLTVLMAR